MTKRKLRKLLRIAYEHGLNEMWRSSFEDWLNEVLKK